MGCLMLVVLGSAMAVIYSQYRYRLLFLEIQKQKKGLDQSNVEWRQLQLDVTTLTDQNKIERNAVDKLKLVMPSRENIIYVKPK